MNRKMDLEDAIGRVDDVGEVLVGNDGGGVLVGNDGGEVLVGNDGGEFLVEKRRRGGPGRKTTEVAFWKIVWISGRPFGDVRVGFGRSRRRGWIHGGGVRPGIAPRGVWVIWKPFWRFGITTRAREIGVQYLQTDVRKKDPQCHPKKLPERGGSVGGSPARGPGAPTSSFVLIFLFYSCSIFANWSGARGGGPIDAEPNGDSKVPNALKQLQ